MPDLRAKSVDVTYKCPNTGDTVKLSNQKVEVSGYMSGYDEYDESIDAVAFIEVKCPCGEKHSVTIAGGFF